MFFYPKDGLWTESAPEDGVALQEELDGVNRIRKDPASIGASKIHTGIMNRESIRDRGFLRRIADFTRDSDVRADADSIQSEHEVLSLQESQPKARMLGLQRKIKEGLIKMTENSRTQLGVETDSHEGAKPCLNKPEIAKDMIPNEGSLREGLHADPHLSGPSIQKGRGDSVSNDDPMREGLHAFSIQEGRALSRIHGHSERPQEGRDSKHRVLPNDVSEDGAEGHDRTNGGFLVLEIDGETMKVDFYDHNAEEIYSYQTSLPRRTS